MRPHQLVLVVLLGTNACSLGMPAAKLPIAQGPAGARADLVLGRTHFHGEVLAVSDSGLLLLGDSAIAFAHYQDIDRGVVADAPADIELPFREAPNSEQREQLRLTSRYPQGVTPEFLRRLLTAYNWNSVGVLRP